MDDNLIWKQTNQTYPMQGQWLDFVILVGPFLLSVFCDSVNRIKVSRVIPDLNLWREFPNKIPPLPCEEGKISLQ